MTMEEITAQMRIAMADFRPTMTAMFDNPTPENMAAADVMNAEVERLTKAAVALIPDGHANG